MEAALLSQLVAVEPAPRLPARTVTKTYPAVPQRDTMSIELGRISGTAARAGTGTATPADVPGFRSGVTTPSDLESSTRPASPVGPVVGHEEDGVEALQSSMCTLWS